MRWRRSRKKGGNLPLTPPKEGRMEQENSLAYHEDFHVSYLQSVEIRVIRGVESLPLTPPKEGRMKLENTPAYHEDFHVSYYNPWRYG